MKNQQSLTPEQLRQIWNEQRVKAMLSEAGNNKARGSKFIKPSYAWNGQSYNDSGFNKI